MNLGGGTEQVEVNSERLYNLDILLFIGLFALILTLKNIALKYYLDY